MQRCSGADVLLAHSWDGKPLTREHGGPVRIIMPQYYLWKSAKWVKHIAFLDRDAPGSWEVRGYHNTGDPWKEKDRKSVVSGKSVSVRVDFGGRRILNKNKF